MTEISKELINKLEHMRSTTQLPLEKRLIDLAVWFHRNKDAIPREALSKRVDFLEKALDIHLEMIAMLVNRMQLTEGRSKHSSLWLPKGIKVADDYGKEIDFG